MTKDGNIIVKEIRKEAQRNGFQAFGITTTSPGPEREKLLKYLSLGYHGDMHWMHTNSVRIYAEKLSTNFSKNLC